MANISYRHVAFRSLLLTTLVAVFFISAGAQCEPKPDEIRWLDGTIKAWKSVRANSLKLAPARLPWLVVFDEECVLNINPDPKLFNRSAHLKPQIRSLVGERVSIYSANHDGKITLPDTQTIPAQLISFAANYDNDLNSFFVAALPSVWAKAEHLRAEKNLATLVRSVYVHELTHTYHRNFFARLSEIEKELTDVGNFDDDVIQNTFGKDERFGKAYLDEIAIANAAAEEAVPHKKRVAAKRLVDAIKKRRSDFYTGQNKKFEEVEDIFLTMEGVANWAAYKAAIADGLDTKTAAKLIRRSGKNWSQEEGILLFMIIDSLLPKWQKAAFADKRVSIVDLLERAVR